MACRIGMSTDVPDRSRGSGDVPLVGYVADEFHRFVTSDLVHGEQSFLDTCRSFGAFCVLATQSVSSLEHALAQGGGSARQDEAAVSILWNNCASKLVFRTTDLRTANRVQDLCPYRPGLAGVTRVRPVSTLAPGECYAILADGRFERRRLEPFASPEPEAERAEGRPAPETGGHGEAAAPERGQDPGGPATTAGPRERRGEPRPRTRSIFADASRLHHPSPREIDRDSFPRFLPRGRPLRVRRRHPRRLLPRPGVVPRILPPEQALPGVPGRGVPRRRRVGRTEEVPASFQIGRAHV